MGIKNRKFNLAGVTFYSADVAAGDRVYFQLEPNNPKDPNAIKALNKNNEVIGYIPRDSALEIQAFIKGKYPRYCAKIKEIWEHEGVRVPKVLAHFALNSDELPFDEQHWIPEI